MELQKIAETRKLVEINKKIKADFIYKWNVFNLVEKPNVFSPKLFKDSFYFYKYLPFKEGHSLLEIGCGSGIISLCAASEKMYVDAVDINEYALQNTRENLLMNKLSERVNIYFSDVFSHVKESKKFDLIFWNVPFIYTESRVDSLLDKSVFSYYYNDLETFFKSYKNFLAESGQAIIAFSNDIGDYSKLKDKANKFGVKLNLYKKIYIREQQCTGGIELELLLLT